MKNIFFNFRNSAVIFWTLVIASILLILNLLVFSPSTIVVLNTLIAISPLLLFIVTLVYAVETHKMASFMKKQSDIMTREFELKISPIIGINGELGYSDKSNIRHAFIIENYGSFPLTIKNISFEYSSLRFHECTGKPHYNVLPNSEILPKSHIHIEHTIPLKRAEMKIFDSVFLGQIDVDWIKCKVIYTDVKKNEYELIGTYENLLAKKMLSPNP